MDVVGTVFEYCEIIMKRVFEVLVGFLKREWFLFVMALVIIFMFVAFEYLKS